MLHGGEGWLRGKRVTSANRRRGAMRRPLTPTLSPNDEPVGGEGVFAATCLQPPSTAADFDRHFAEPLLREHAVEHAEHEAGDRAADVCHVVDVRRRFVMM